PSLTINFTLGAVKKSDGLYDGQEAPKIPPNPQRPVGCGVRQIPCVWDANCRSGLRRQPLLKPTPGLNVRAIKQTRGLVSRDLLRSARRLLAVIDEYRPLPRLVLGVNLRLRGRRDEVRRPVLLNGDGLHVDDGLVPDSSLRLEAPDNVVSRLA